MGFIKTKHFEGSYLVISLLQELCKATFVTSEVLKKSLPLPIKEQKGENKEVFKSFLFVLGLGKRVEEPRVGAGNHGWGRYRPVPNILENRQGRPFSFTGRAESRYLEKWVPRSTHF